MLPTLGGRDSGRLGSSVRTWLAEAATAADLKGGSGRASPPSGKSLIFFVIVQKVAGDLTGFADLSHWAEVTHFLDLDDVGHLTRLTALESLAVLLDSAVLTMLAAARLI